MHKTIKFTFLFLSIGLLFSACDPAFWEAMQQQQQQQQQQPRGKSTNPTDKTAKTTTRKKDDPNKGKVVVAKIRRTACYGKCPVYEAVFYSDGTVTYSGKRFVKMTGDYEAKVNVSVIEQIKNKAHSIKYCKLADKYPVSGKGVPDFPNTITYVKVDSHEHGITNNSGAPAELINFEKYLDDILKGLSWKKKGGAKKLGGLKRH